jgi:PAS domain S-box-containing protein
MSKPDLDQKKARQEQELKIQRQIAFASELFQGDVTVRTLLESLAEGVVIIDNTGTILLVNSHAERMFGYPDKELIGQPQAVLIPERYRKVHEEHLAHFFAEPRLRPPDQHLALAGCRRDGSEFPVEISLNYIETINGVFALAFVCDITSRKIMEDALRFSEERYRTLFRDNPTMIVTLDTDLTMLSVNPVCASQLGYTIDELEGQPVLRLFHEEDHPAVIKQLRMCLQKIDQVHRWQFRKVRKDGSPLWVEETAQAVYDLKGALNLLVVCQDITERKRTEEALRESENKFSKVFQVTPSILVITSLADGRYLEVNEAFERVMGYRRDEVIGRSSLELNVWQKPEDRKYVFQMLAEGMKVRDMEVGFRSKSGTILIGLFSAEIIEVGTEQCLLSLVNDITARKQAEEALRKSEKKFLTVFHAVPAMLGITTQAEGIFIDVNETCMRILGYQRDEVIGHTSLELGIWGSQEERDRTMRVLEEHGTVRDIEINLRGKTGESFVGLLSAEYIDIAGERYILSMINDITQRKRMEEEIERLNVSLTARASDLEYANQELEAFNYTVAHDLRNPLNVISSYCQVIKELCSDNLGEECRRYIQETYDGTLRMNRLIEALLNFSQMAHAKLNTESVDLSIMAREVAEELKGTDAGRRVEFLIADGIADNGDANLLRVVLMNLLGNAWKYTAARKEAVIEFGTKEVDGKPVYFVRDNGSGFDNAAAEKIFVPFQRLPGAEECRGFGIGLATVERIIRRHGGMVCAEGEPGKGATFWFTI